MTRQNGRPQTSRAPPVAAKPPNVVRFCFVFLISLFFFVNKKGNPRRLNLDQASITSPTGPFRGMECLILFVDCVCHLFRPIGFCSDSVCFFIVPTGVDVGSFYLVLPSFFSLILSWPGCVADSRTFLPSFTGFNELLPKQTCFYRVLPSFFFIHDGVRILFTICGFDVDS